MSSVLFFSTTSIVERYRSSSTLIKNFEYESGRNSRISEWMLYDDILHASVSLCSVLEPSEKGM